jgi:tryptophan synthase alpha chain
MNAIDALFQELRRHQRKAFIPFVPAGDPDIQTSTRLVRELVQRGASIVEIGFPYSDPIADGSVIQASYTRALAKGLHVDDVFEMIRGFGELKCSTHAERDDYAVPLVGMVSYSLVYHRGPARFLADAIIAGLSGAIVPDLPVPEGDEFAALAAARDFKLIQLVTPTTPPERAVQIVQRSTGFVYVVSVAGITGARNQLPPELLDQLRWLGTQTSLPLCVGFGISKPEQVRMLREAVDGVIVGSALVRPLEQAYQQPISMVLKEIGDLAESLANALAAQNNGK